MVQNDNLAFAIGFSLVSIIPAAFFGLVIFAFFGKRIRNSIADGKITRNQFAWGVLALVILTPIAIVVIVYSALNLFH